MFFKRKPPVTIPMDHYNNLLKTCSAVLKWSLRQKETGNNVDDLDFVKLAIQSAKGIPGNKNPLKLELKL